MAITYLNILRTYKHITYLYNHEIILFSIAINASRTCVGICSKLTGNLNCSYKYQTISPSSVSIVVGGVMVNCSSFTSNFPPYKIVVYAIRANTKTIPIETITFLKEENDFLVVLALCNLCLSDLRFVVFISLVSCFS